MSRRDPLSFYEFFAGGGMARAGLGADWRCLFANDLDPLKARTYRANWGDEDLVEGDVWKLSAGALPGRADLAWASSPCQDFSLAGARAGLGGGRSSAFYGFWRLVEALDDEGRAPRAVVLENVGGLLNSHGGADFAAVCGHLAERGYRFGAVEIDAAAFLPQSRPRVFVVATREPAAPGLAGQPGAFHSTAVRAAHARLSPDLQARWLWWRLDPPAARNARLADVLAPDDEARWRSPAQTEALLAQMNPLHRARLETAGAGGGRVVAAVYRRIRREGGERVQRAELRVDGLAGCLRTPGGGSSRQFLVVAEAGRVRSRLLTAREGARLMGLPDHYRLPASESGGLKVVGDGVAVPVVRLLAERLLEPLLGQGAAIAAAE
ncbi:MAG: DNA cytosine methyltransferase [Caulobacteraceae bacterium]|nr:DNA cytosine methyltransferase [Caulobacteraceae bacterium]